MLNWLGVSDGAAEDTSGLPSVHRPASDRNGRQAAEPLPGCSDLLGGLQPNAGKVGLKNLGNTCFMNAGLQCLSHIEPLAEFFLSGRYKEEVNVQSPMGSQGKLSAAFAQLQKEVWQPSGRVSDPRDLHRRLSKICPYLFEGSEQQDIQEFIAFCLDGLHEDLNRVVKRAPRTEADEKAQEELENTRGDDVAAVLAWRRYLENGKSFLVDLLQGQLRSSLTCQRCGHSSRRFDPFLYLSVPVSRRMTRVMDAVEKYLEEESLSGDERWYCEKCKQKVDASKKIDLWMLPPVLVLHLKRFEFDPRTFRFQKIKALLSAPLSLDLSPLCPTKQRDGALYNVVCVANHIGQFGSGHYTATCRVGNAENGCWHYFDDERVRPLVAGQDVISPEAYVIFLVRCKASTSAFKHSALKRQSVTMPELWPHWIATRESVLVDLDLVANGAAPGAAQDAARRGDGRGAALRPTSPASSATSSGGVTPLVECWLGKRGPTAQYGWTWRWCVLETGKLVYYQDMECKVKKGEITIRPSSRAMGFSERSCPGDAASHLGIRPFGFVLDSDQGAGKDRRLYYFDAGNAPMLKAWISAIATAASVAAKAKAPVPLPPAGAAGRRNVHLL